MAVQGQVADCSGPNHRPVPPGINLLKDSPAVVPLIGRICLNEFPLLLLLARLRPINSNPKHRRTFGTSMSCGRPVKVAAM